MALAQLAGGLAAPLHGLRTSLLDLLAHLEAGLDFADEEIEFISADNVQQQLRAAAETVAGLRDQMKSRNVAHAHTRAVLVGPPNAGKSSLFNALAQRSGALVSSEPGTTRDYLVAELNLDGVACHLVDTAGMEEIPLPYPAETYAPDHTAQTLGDEQRRMAEIWILCLDATRPESWTSLLPGEENANVHVLRVLTKADAVSAPTGERCELATSSTTGQGIESLRARLRETIVAQDDNGRSVAATASRCRESLAGASESLRRAGKLVADDIGEDSWRPKSAWRSTNLGRSLVPSTPTMCSIASSAGSASASKRFAQSCTSTLFGYSSECLRWTKEVAAVVNRSDPLVS